MNHKEFIKVIHKDLKSAGLSKSASESNEIASIIFDAMQDTLAKGHNIEILNFGSLKLHLRKVRDLSKPGAPGIERWTISFSIARKLSLRINEHLRENER